MNRLRRYQTHGLSSETKKHGWYYGWFIKASFTKNKVVVWGIGNCEDPVLHSMWHVHSNLFQINRSVFDTRRAQWRQNNDKHEQNQPHQTTTGQTFQNKQKIHGPKRPCKHSPKHQTISRAFDIRLPSKITWFSIMVLYHPRRKAPKWFVTQQPTRVPQGLAWAQIAQQQISTSTSSTDGVLQSRRVWLSFGHFGWDVLELFAAGMRLLGVILCESPNKARPHLSPAYVSEHGPVRPQTSAGSAKRDKRCQKGGLELPFGGRC